MRQAGSLEKEDGHMNIFNQIVYMVGAVTTVLCIILCLALFVACKSRDKNGRRIELDNHTNEAPWSLGVWIAGVFVAGTGVALMYAPGDLVGYVQQGLNPAESVTMVALLNGAPVWAMYSVMGIPKSASSPPCSPRSWACPSRSGPA